MKEKEIEIQQALDYEIRSHWLASYIWFNWGQELMGSYIAWKVNKKYRRYKHSRYMKQYLRSV